MTVVVHSGQFRLPLIWSGLPTKPCAGAGVTLSITIHIVTKSYIKAVALTSSDYGSPIHSLAVRSPPGWFLEKREEHLWPTLIGTSKPKSRAFGAMHGH